MLSRDYNREKSEQALASAVLFASKAVTPLLCKPRQCLIYRVPARRAPIDAILQPPLFSTKHGGATFPSVRLREWYE